MRPLLPSWPLLRLRLSNRGDSGRGLGRTRWCRATGTATRYERYEDQTVRANSRQNRKCCRAQQQPVQADGESGAYQHWPTSALLGEKMVICSVPSPHNTKPRPRSGIEVLTGPLGDEFQPATPSGACRLLDQAGLLARGSSSRRAFPSGTPSGQWRLATLVPPHSCGAAGASHPLPSWPSWDLIVGRLVLMAQRSVNGARLRLVMRAGNNTEPQ